MQTDNHAYSCLVCNAQLHYIQSTNCIYCNQCNTINFKNENNILEVLLIPQIKVAHPLIKTGTSGIWKNQKFTITGRSKFWFEEGIENYWTIIFEDNTIGYLKCSEGFYSIMFQSNIDISKTNFNFSNLKSNQNIKLSDEESIKYIAHRKSNYIESEGNFYLPKFSIDLTFYSFISDKEHSFEIIKFNHKDKRVFSEEFIEIESLLLKNINDSDNSFKINCCCCNKEIDVLYPDTTVALVCKHCNTQLLLNKNELEKTGLNEVEESKIAFNLNDAIVLENINYIVTGIAIKQEQNYYKSKWREYSLYNKEKGYVFLNEYNGHWLKVQKIKFKDDIEVGNGFTTLTFDNKIFDLYNTYSYKTIFAKGEFCYNLFDVENTKCYEYIAPPYLVSKEKNKQIINWYKGNYVSKSVLKRQTNIKLPYSIGVGAVDTKGSIKSNTIAIVGLALLALSFLLHMLTTSVKTSKQLFKNSYTLPDSSQIFTTTINDIFLNKNSSNIQLNVYAPLNNNWLEISAKLVNTKDGTEYNVEKGLEYYSGYDSEGSWSEGSTTDEIFINQVPNGTYVLSIQATQNNSLDIKRFDIEAIYDVPNNSNFFICIGLIIALCFIMFLINYSYDYNRWRDSPYLHNKYPATQNE